MDRFAFRFFIVILLTVTSIVLLRMSDIVGSSSRSGESDEAYQTVRRYYSALNYFLSGGEFEDFAQLVGASETFPPTGI